MTNYFELFGIEQAFFIDLDELQTQYHKLQQTYHPDLIAQNDTNISQSEAVKKSSQINDGFKTLSMIDKRAVYLLSLVNQPIKLENSIDDLSFLHQALEVRESLEDANDITELETLLDESKQWLQELSQTFEQHYKCSEYDMAGDIAKKLSFITKLIDDINEAIYNKSNSEDSLELDLF